MLTRCFFIPAIAAATVILGVARFGQPTSNNNNSGYTADKTVRSFGYQLFAVVAMVIGCGWLIAAEPDPHSSRPEKMCTPDHSYCIAIVQKKLRQSPESEDAQLLVEKHGKAIAHYPTYGFLSDVYWSPDRKYVAVNNRRANGGDYLWVIAMAHGTPLKMPRDLADALGKKYIGDAVGDPGPIEQEVVSKYPQCNFPDGIHNEWLTPVGWKSPTEVDVLHRIRCQHSDTVIEVKKIYEVSGNNVKLKAQTISERALRLDD